MTQTVLAIDDSDDILALLAVRLMSEDVRLITARDFETGLTRARGEHPISSSSTWSSPRRAASISAGA